MAGSVLISHNIEFVGKEIFAGDKVKLRNYLKKKEYERKNNGNVLRYITIEKTQDEYLIIYL